MENKSNRDENETTSVVNLLLPIIIYFPGPESITGA